MTSLTFGGGRLAGAGSIPGDVGAASDWAGLSGVAGVDELDEPEELLLPGVEVEEVLADEPGSVELPGLLLDPEEGWVSGTFAT